jgi:DNA-binding response OmpR family regulator
VYADIYQDAHLCVNFQTGAVELDGAPRRLANKEYELLAYLLRHPKELVSREVLLAMIWGYGPGIRTRTLDVHIRRLRQNLEPYGKVYIETVFSIGYRFQPYVRKRGEAAGLGGTVESMPRPDSWHWNQSTQ